MVCGEWRVGRGGQGWGRRGRGIAEKETQMTSQNPDVASGEKWQLRLYVAGQTPKSLAAMRNLISSGANAMSFSSVK